MDHRSGHERLRIAVLSTPRSGNTWLRHLLAMACELTHLAVDRPADIPWESLPERCVIQLHWQRDEPLAALLERHQVRVAVIARHPLDVLISLLGWVDNCPGPRAIWSDAPSLDGLHGDETALFDATPADDAFRAYATGPRAGALLGVSVQWWSLPSALRVRYEDLVGRPEETLSRLLTEVGEVPRRPIEAVLSANTIEGLRSRHEARSLHFWQGSPGLWRRLIPAATARNVAVAHPSAFAPFGYDCDPDPNLTRDRAEAGWFRLQREAARRELERRAVARPSPGLEAVEQALDATRRHLDDVLRRLYEEQVAHAATRAERDAAIVHRDEALRLLYESRVARAAG